MVDTGVIEQREQPWASGLPVLPVGGKAPSHDHKALSYHTLNVS